MEDTEGRRSGRGRRWSRRRVKLRPLGGNDYEIRRDDQVLGTAHFERYRTSERPCTRGWVTRRSEPTIPLNAAYFEDFARLVRSLFSV